MNKKVLFVFSILFLFVVAGSTVVSAGEKYAGETGVETINMTLSGLIMKADDFGRSIFDINLKGSPGKANGRGVGFTTAPVPYEALPEGNACIDTGSPVDGVLFSEAQMTMNFNDGSMLFGNIADGAYICFAPGYAYGPYVIAGGTGRYEGASGWVDFHIHTHRFNFEGHPSLVTAETGTVIGEIFLP